MTALQHLSCGNRQSNNLVVFLQGWPDNSAVWDCLNWRDDLANQHLVFIDLPNTTGKIDSPWGVDFQTLTSQIKFTIDSLGVQNKNKVLVAHDWGCYYGYLLDQRYPQFFSKIIALDVPAKVQLKGFKQILFVLAYQLTLVIAFLIGGKIGKFITQTMMKLFKHNPEYKDQVHSGQNYPYFYMMRNILYSALGKEQRLLKGYHPSVPIIYLYAGKKPFQFHGDKWLQEVKKSGGEVHKMQAGHWFMKKYAKFITDLIKKSLESTVTP